MRHIKFLLLFCAFLWSSFLHADVDLLMRKDVQNYINQQIENGKFRRYELENIFANIQMQPRIIDLFDRPATSQPWYVFRPKHLKKSLINNGVKFWQANHFALSRAYKIYGVSPAVIVAIIGIESNYGRISGNFRLADVLATIAFDYPRRADFFRNEFAQLLLMSKEEKKNIFSFQGSYAGAMGMPQFMPSSFRKWAVDFDGDSRRDIWGNNSDAIGSVANYFFQHGWLRDGLILLPAKLKDGAQIDALISDKFNLHYSLDDLKKFGVVPQGQIAGKIKAVLFPLQTSEGVYRYYLGLNNFYVITLYNKSILYGKVVQELAAAIENKYYEH